MKLAPLIKYIQYKKEYFAIIVNTDEYIGTESITVRKSIVDDLEKCIEIIDKAMSLQGVKRIFYTENNSTSISSIMSNFVEKATLPFDTNWLSDECSHGALGCTLVNKSKTIIVKEKFFDEHKELLSCL